MNLFARLLVAGTTSAVAITSTIALAGSAQAAPSRLTYTGELRVGSTLTVNQSDAGDVVWTLWSDSSCTKDVGYAFGSPFTVPTAFTGEYPTYTNNGSSVATQGKYLTVDVMGSSYSPSSCSAAIQAAATPTATPTTAPTSASPTVAPTTAAPTTAAPTTAAPTTAAPTTTAPTSAAPSTSAAAAGGGGGGGGGAGATPVGLLGETLAWASAPSAPSVGQLLTASITPNPSDASVSYVWGRQTGSSCSAYLPVLAGATATISSSMVGDIPCVVMTGSKTGYADASRTVYASQAIASGGRTIPWPQIMNLTNGAPQVGKQLTCQTAAGTPGTPSFTWLRGVVSVGSGATYTPSAADLGQPISCVLTVSESGWAPTSINAGLPPVVAGDPATYTVAVTGKVAVGQILKAGVAAPSGSTVKWSWLVSGKQVATSASYVVRATDYNKPITVSAVIAVPGYRDATASTDLGRAKLRRLVFTVDQSRVPRNGRVHFRARSLAPGQAWVVRWQRTGAVLAHGRVGAHARSVDGVLRLPARMRIGTHALEFRTIAPHQRVGTHLRVVARR